MLIQDDIDIRYNKGQTGLEIVESGRPGGDKALFYRAYQDGLMIKNGWIEKNALVELRVMINQALRDENTLGTQADWAESQ